jgi:FkbM family methyltransferase
MTINLRVLNTMNWWYRKKLRGQTVWLRMAKFYYSVLKKNYLKKNYFVNASALDVKEVNRQCIDPSNVIVKCSFKDKDYFLHSTSKSLIENYAHKYGVWEPNLAKFIHSILNNKNKKGLFIDIGANIGATTIPQAVSFPHINFLCIEAHPTVFELLKANINLNSLDNVCCINKAVSNAANGNKVDFYAQKSDASNLGLSSLQLNKDIQDYDVLSVESIKVDALDDAIDTKVFIIKADTQGSELDVFQSCVHIIEKHYPIIIFEYEEGYHDSPTRMREDITNFFENLGYAFYTVPTSENVMFRLTLKDFYHGDIVGIPMSACGAPKK